jgi:hypothetical protein
MLLNKNISVRIEPRPDGGIRVWSPQIKGLVLSGSDPAKVMADIWPAIVGILSPTEQRTGT